MPKRMSFFCSFLGKERGEERHLRKEITLMNNKATKEIMKSFYLQKLCSLVINFAI